MAGHILVIGGTGRAGRAVVDEALSQGNIVTVLVRAPPKDDPLPTNPNLHLVQGSPMKSEDISHALSSATTPITAVIITLNARRVSDSPFAALAPDSPLTLVEDATKAALAAMRGTSTRKLVLLSQQGSGASYKGISLLHKGLFSHSNMKYALKDHDAAEKVVRAAAEKCEVDFVIVRPVMFVEGEAAPVKNWGELGDKAGFMPKITRKSAARFMVEAAGNAELDGTAPVISN